MWQSHPYSKKSLSNHSIQNKTLKTHINKQAPSFSFLTSFHRFLVLLGLGFLSWFTTYTGILEFIKANSGELNFQFRLAVAFAVAMLTLMTIYILNNLFSPLKWWLRSAYIFGYVFLTLISVGFGFGFYWKFLESRTAANHSAQTAISNVQTSLHAAYTRLAQLQTTLDALSLLSKRKAEQERTIGKTCHKSPPGDGPRLRLRNDDAYRFNFASQLVSQRVKLINQDIVNLNTYADKLARSYALQRPKETQKQHSKAHYQFLRALDQKLNLILARFNTFRTDPQLLQFRDDFAKRANQKYFKTSSGRTFFCPDRQLQSALLGAVKAIDEIPQIEKSDILTIEGSEAVIEAFRRLITTFTSVITFQLSSSAPPSTKNVIALSQNNRMSALPKYSVENSLQKQQRFLSLEKRKSGLSERDYLPLFIALFVDLCILLVSMNRSVNRLHPILKLTRNTPDERLHYILKSFHDVHMENRSSHLDIFYNTIFDIGSKQYVAVPIDMRSTTGPHDGSLADRLYYKNHENKHAQMRYLNTLMVTLEEAGMVQRANHISTARAGRRLRQLKSPYADAPGFRIYSFKKNAWPTIILNDILGQADEMNEEKSITPPPIPVESLSLPPPNRLSDQNTQLSYYGDDEKNEGEKSTHHVKEAKASYYPRKEHLQNFYEDKRSLSERLALNVHTSSSLKVGHSRNIQKTLYSKSHYLLNAISSFIAKMPDTKILYRKLEHIIPPTYVKGGMSLLSESCRKFAKTYFTPQKFRPSHIHHQWHKTHDVNFGGSHSFSSEKIAQSESTNALHKTEMLKTSELTQGFANTCENSLPIVEVAPQSQNPKINTMQSFEFEKRIKKIHQYNEKYDETLEIEIEKIAKNFAYHGPQYQDQEE
ncbi:MAG: hypothetical protein AAF228_01250 [Pseudomonadota bacterium]